MGNTLPKHQKYCVIAIGKNRVQFSVLSRWTTALKSHVLLFRCRGLTSVLSEGILV